MISTPAPPDILSREHAADPYETYRILLEHYPVLYHESTKSWLVSRHEYILALFKLKEMSSRNYKWQHEPIGRAVIQMEGKEHTAHRRLLDPFFRGSGLEAFKETIAEAARALAEPFLAREAVAVASGRKARGEVELVSSFTQQFPITVIEEMLGLPKEDHPKFERWYRAIMDSSRTSRVTRSGSNGGCRAAAS
jgi:cytochrome P450